MTSDLSEQQREVVLLLLNQGATSERERVLKFVNEIEDEETRETLVSKINGVSNDS